MGHSNSADKRERQNAKRRLSNRDNRSALRKELKRIGGVIEAGSAEPAKTMTEAFKALDKAARKNAIPKKRADRKKSRIALALNRMKKAAASKTPKA